MLPKKRSLKPDKLFEVGFPMHYFVKGYYEPPEDTEHDKRVYFPTNEQCERLFQKA